MAAVKSGRPIGVLEDAVRLLRSAGFSVVSLHWMGSVPLALALLLYWSALTRGGMTNEECALWSLAVGLLYLWMHVSRAMFAARLWRTLEGGGRTRWTFSAISLQAFLGTAKIVIWPMALLVGFPFARAVAFFRYAASLSARADLDGIDVIPHARRLASLDNGLNWAILPLQWLIGFAVTANLALTFAMLPALIRMLTGYESAFSRGQEAFITSPLFLIVSMVGGWLAFDPFVQAVYCVRCFQAQSLETGEDLRVRLRSLRSPAAALVLLAIFIAVPRHAIAAASAGELQEGVRKAMQAPEYSWRLPKAPVTGIRGTPWLVAVTERVLQGINSALKWLGHAIETIVKWLFGRLGMSPGSDSAPLPATAMHWSMYLLLAAAAAAILTIAWRKQVFRRRPAKPAEQVETAIRVDDENVAADRLPDSRWLEMAASLLDAENFRLALRAFYLANLAWLGQGRWVTIDQGKTNREYELELQRRANQAAEARALFADNIAAFERCWYGMHGVSRDDVEAFRQRLTAMKERLA